MTNETSIAATRWVLVAGTGLVEGTPIGDVLAAKAIGTELARNRYGLITGAWPGVDYLATQAFVEELHRQGLDPDNYLIQVSSPHRAIDLRFGKTVHVPEGPSEWLEPQKYADAIVIIGGLGGTYKTWLGALHDGLPRFPFGGTDGDATTAFNQTKELWEIIPIPGISLGQFERLDRRIDSAEAAAEVAQYITDELLWRALSAVDASSRNSTNNANSIFISYSRRDAEWVSRIRTLLRPAERRGAISTWVDSDIESGKGWEPQILERLNSVSAALLLVSPSLLASTYVREIELPAFERRLTSGTFRMYWVLLEQCDWQEVPLLSRIQAIGDTKSAINECQTKSDEQCRLIDVVETIAGSKSPN